MWIILSGKDAAQIGNGISNPVIAGIVYWLIRILICGGCLAGMLVAIIGIKVVDYKEVLLGYDYHNGNTYMHGSNNPLWRLDRSHPLFLKWQI